MKFLLVGGRYVNTDRIDAVLLPGSRHAAVWHNGIAEPLQARADEVSDIQQYVLEAQYGGSRV